MFFLSDRAILNLITVNSVDKCFELLPQFLKPKI